MPTRLLKPVRALDHRLFGLVARTHAPWLDRTLPALTRMANHSKLWIVLAALLGVRGGRRELRAALRGTGSIAFTSPIINLLVKRLVRRPRPALRHVPAVRRLSSQPLTTSFPSGHAASAFAFAVGASSELPAARIPLTLLASAVAYSRVYVGVHYPVDVVVGAAFGAAVARASRAAVPVLPKEARDAPATTTAVELDAAPRGEGVALVVNRTSGSAMAALDAVRDMLPDAHVIEIDRAEDLEPALAEAAERCRVLGICGGDGSAGSAARVAMGHGRPLLLIPGGTLDHLARDLRIESPTDSVEALERGEGLRVDVAVIDDRVFVNTASLGGYAGMIDAREALRHRIGRWPAHFIAAFQSLRASMPMTVTLNGRRRRIWMVYIGNCRHEPAGYAPSWRPRLDDGLLDVRLVHAEVALSRTRLLASLLTGRLTRSRAYEQSCELRLDVDMPEQVARITCDGDSFDVSGRFEVTKHERALAVYAPTRPVAASP